MITWTVAINGKLNDTGSPRNIPTFNTKKACQEYINQVYYGGIQKLLNIKPVKISIEIV